MYVIFFIFFFFSSRRRHTRFSRDWSSDVCSSDLRGIRGKVDEKEVAVGNENWFKELGIVDSTLSSRAEELRRNGQTVIFVSIDRRVAGLLGVADPVKPSTPQAIRDLKRDGLRLAMLTGDSRATAENIARQLGI